MKITISDSKKAKQNVEAAKCSTPNRGVAGRRTSVASNTECKRIPITSENDEFDLWDHNRGLERTRNPSTCWKPVLMLFVACTIIAVVIFTPSTTVAKYKNWILGTPLELDLPNTCASACKIELVESIPEGLIYPEESPTFLSTYEAWDRLIKMANKSIDFGSFYWSLRSADFYNHSSAWQGDKTFDSILKAGTKRGIKIRIVQNEPSASQPNLDTEILVKQKAATVRSLDLRRLLGAGILHTKLWIVDGKHMYVGSANMDWRSLTQVKELGALVTNCTCLVDDISKIFNVYWDLAQAGSVIPPNWPDAYSTKINASNPMPVEFNDDYKMNTYFSSSPPPLSPAGRSQDIDAILNVIQTAEKFIHISVMDYMPLSLYTPKPKYWPVIDDALRSAAIDRRVSVKLLISFWNHSRPAEDNFLNSLKDISNAYRGVDVQVRRFIVPSTDDQAKIPFARVNHNKYMVTDNTGYIGTSNWSADYFIDTAGIGFILQETSADRNESIRKELASIFDRDWNSEYAVDLKRPVTDFE